ncbi:MAG: hypothetical protein NTW52_15840 [Planctomycetota bacterium]|nr:hypothetical protein [Planctomycetota bacterium]
MHDRRLVASFFYLAVFSAFSAQVAFAQATQSARLTAPQLLPENTLAYVRIDDTRELKEKLAQTSTGRMASDPQVSPLLQEFYGSFRDSAQAMQQVIGINLDELLSIPNGELAIAVVSAKMEVRKRKIRNRESGEEVEREFTRPKANLVILLEAGDQLPAVEILLERIESQIESRGAERTSTKIGAVNTVRWMAPTIDGTQNSDRQFGYFIDSGVVVLTSDANYIDQLAKVWTGNAVDHVPLTSNRKFTSILTRCVGADGERPQVSFYADPYSLAKELTAGNTAASLVMGLLPSLGVDGIQAVGGSLIMVPKDFDSIAHAHLLLANPRRGVLQVLRPKRGSTDPQPWVSEDVASFMTINWDVAATLAAVKELAETFRGPDFYQEDFINRASKELGIDFQKDFLDQIDDRITTTQVILKPARLNAASNVYAVRLKNGRLFGETTLPKIFSQLSSKDAKWKSEQYGSFMIYTQPTPTSEANASGGSPSAIRRSEPSFTMLDNELLMADSIEAIKLAIETSKSTDGLLSDAIEFKLVRDRINKQIDASQSSIMLYQRPEEQMRVMYDLAADKSNVNQLRDMSKNNPLFTALVKALDNHQLPPFEQIAKYLSPGGAFVIEEENGLHYTAFGMRRGK